MLSTVSKQLAGATPPVGEELARAILCALAIQPEDRFLTGQHMQQALAAVPGVSASPAGIAQMVAHAFPERADLNQWIAGLKA